MLTGNSRLEPESVSATVSSTEASAILAFGVVADRVLGRIGARTLGPLGAVMLLSVALRVASGLYQGDAVAALAGIADQLSYHTLALRVLGGDGFTFPAAWWPATRAGEPTAHWSFLYTLYLVCVYALFGPHPLAARLIQGIVVGLLYPWVTWRIGRRLFGPRVGMVAAAVGAIYPYFIYYAGALMTESFYILALLLALELATGRLASRVAGGPSQGDKLPMAGAYRDWALLGLALATAAMLRQLSLLVAPLLFGWLLWLAWTRGPAFGAMEGQAVRSALAGVAISCLVIAAAVLPWTARNYQAFGRFVLLNTNAGYVFFWGNHPIHGTDFVPILPNRVYYELIPREIRDLDEAALDQELLRRGVSFVMADLGRYALLSASRVDDYFMFWPSNNSTLVSNAMRIFSAGILLPLALYGLLLSIFRRGPVCLGQGSSAALLMLFATSYSGIHILSWTLVRYRLPVDAVLVPFVALAISDLVIRFGLWGRFFAPDMARHLPQ